MVQNRQAVKMFQYSTKSITRTIHGSGTTEPNSTTSPLLVSASKFGITVCDAWSSLASAMQSTMATIHGLCVRVRVRARAIGKVVACMIP